MYPTRWAPVDRRSKQSVALERLRIVDTRAKSGTAQQRGAQLGGPHRPDFDRFYQEHYRPLLRMAYVLCGNRQLAEDLVQEGFLVAFRRWDVVGTYQYPEAWIRRVVANRAASSWRRAYAEAGALLRLRGSRDSQGELAESTATFWERVRSLPRSQAQALVLFYMDGYSTAEIARVLGCADSTARVHLHKGRQALRRKLGLEEEEGR